MVGVGFPLALQVRTTMLSTVSSRLVVCGLLISGEPLGVGGGGSHVVVCLETYVKKNRGCFTCDVNDKEYVNLLHNLHNVFLSR